MHSAGEYMVTLINRARANPTAEAARFGINLNEGLPPGTISAAPKQPLAPNQALLNSIEGHLQWWLSVFNPSVPPPHIGPGGSTPQTRAAAAGYANPYGVGENLAWWGQSPPPSLQTLVNDMYQMLFVDSNVAGRGHRVNMLNNSYQEIGSNVVGGYVPAGYPYAGMDIALTGQDFGIPLPGNAFLTGAVYTDANGNGAYDIGEGQGGVTLYVTQGNAVVATTTTRDSGAYSLRLAPGTYTLIASGGGLSAPRSKTITLGATNFLADLTAADTVGAPATFLAAQLGTFGVWRFSSTAGWKQLSPFNTSQVAVDSHGDVAAVFPGAGTYRFEDGTGWVQLSPFVANAVDIAGYGNVVAEFTGRGGVYRFQDATGWQNLSPFEAALVKMDDNGDIAAVFPGAGTYRFVASVGWQGLTPAVAARLSIAGNGIVAADFLGYGTYRFENSVGWQRLSPFDATSLAVDAYGDVAAAFNGSGVWRFKDGSGWVQLPSANATQVAIDNRGDVAAEFNGFGVWLFRDTVGWKQLTPVDAVWLDLAGG
jgi:hypothetical protein